MVFFGYILHSMLTGEYYVGQTCNLQARVRRHNRGTESSTKHGRPWTLVLSIPFSTRADAIHWEKKVKGRKSRALIERLIREHSPTQLAHSVPPLGRDENPRPVPAERDLNGVQVYDSARLRLAEGAWVSVPFRFRRDGTRSLPVVDGTDKSHRSD